MYSHAPDDYECPLCRYVAGQPNEVVELDHIIERTDEVLTFLSPRWWPNNPGNVMVIPLAHYENVFELPDRLGTPLQRAVRRTALAMKLAYNCDGISTRQHNEPAGNQDVWHYHVHVFPRFENDDLYLHRGSRAPKPEMSRLASQLRSALETILD